MIAFVIKSAICMVLFFGLYWLLLRKEKLFIFTRFYLILSVILSLTIPFISFPVNIGYEKVPVVTSLIPDYIPDAAPSWNEEDIAQQDIVTSGNIHSDQLNRSDAVKPIVIDDKKTLVFIYITGLAFMLIRFSRNILKVNRLLKRSEKIDNHWYRIALLDDKICPFSFLRTVFLNKLDYIEKKVGTSVLSHELEHIRQGHSLDIIFFEILHLLLWFNPALLLYKRAARINHEYLADEAVINGNTDIRTYANELITFISHRLTVPYASGFSPSMIRLRLFMLNRPVPKKSTSTFRISMTVISFVTLGFIPCIEPTYSQSSTVTTVSDIDGNVYKTIEIGDRIFMAENLMTTSYNDGTEIPLITDNGRWSEYSEGFCWYKNDPSDKETNGALYNWYAVNTGKLCPAGWHVPGKVEFYNFIIKYPGIGTYGFEGDPERIAKSLATSSGWEPDTHPGNVGYDQKRNNQSGFNLIPAGMRIQNGNFDNSGRIGLLWSSSDENEFVGSGFFLASDDARFNQFFPSKRTGASVRCMKDYSDNMDQESDLIPQSVLKRSKIPDNQDIVIDEVLFRDLDFKPLKALLVLDGKKLGVDDIFSINTGDIKTINILKNRKASRKYGRNAKDGVVEISTYANDKKSVPDSLYFKPLYTINDTTPENNLTIAVSNLNSLRTWTYPIFPNQDLVKRWRLLEIMTRDYYKIDGTVVQKNGEPLKGVKVSATDNPYETVTDEVGHFLLDDVRSESLVTLSAEGYEPLTFKAIGRVFKTSSSIVLYRSDEPDPDMIISDAGNDIEDFSGTWKFNKDQSKTYVPEGYNMSYLIRQFDSDSLVLTSTSIISGNERKNITTFVFNTAKRNVYLDSNRSTIVRCTISHDGRSFTLTHKSRSLVRTPGGFTADYKSVDTFSLTGDGKQLIIREYNFRDASSDKGEEVQVRVFDKI